MEKLIITQKETQDLACELANKIYRRVHNKMTIRLYPVPRGGVPVVYLLLHYYEYFKIVENPSEADVIVDDLIDSGRTMCKYSSSESCDTLFLALIDKRIDMRYHGKWIVFPWEKTLEKNDESVTDVPLRFLQYINEDVNREGLKDTPGRVVKSWEELYSGYGKKVEDVVTVFSNEGGDKGDDHRGKFTNNLYDQMVLLRDIEFYSTCEHHILPFFGKIHIAYIPDKKVIGISKLSRVVEIFSRRLQIQERLTQQIADGLQDALKPLGMAVYCEAVHFCMIARGVKKQNATMITSAITGVYKKQEVRDEFFNLLKVGR